MLCQRRATSDATQVYQQRRPTSSLSRRTRRVPSFLLFRLETDEVRSALVALSAMHEPCFLLQVYQPPCAATPYLQPYPHILSHIQAYPRPPVLTPYPILSLRQTARVPQAKSVIVRLTMHILCHECTSMGPCCLHGP